MTTKFKKGFTLIELLVVIAIIGILSSIVLGSLSSARTKGEDTAIVATLANMRGQADLYYTNNSNYGGVTTTAFDSTCPATATASTTAGLFGVSGGLLALSTDLVSKAGGASNTNCAVPIGGAAWAAAAVLKSDPTKVACVDSTGVSKTSVITLANAIVANACQ